MPFNVKLIFPAIVVVLIIAFFSLFTVKEWQHAAVFRLGSIERSDFQPGLHYLIPVVNNVRHFESWLLNLDNPPERFITSEKKDVIVDYYVKWRIANVEKFYTANNGGDIFEANSSLAQRINSALRDEFGARTVQQVVAGERSEVMAAVQEATVNLPTELGIEVIDVRTKRIDLPEEVSNSVYERMRAERERVAKDFRARGAEAAERIRANADKEREVILADAYKDAEIKRGEGDAQATEIYAAAFGKDEEFYAMYRSLNAYQNSFNNGNDVLLLEPDSEFFKFFKQSGARE